MKKTFALLLAVCLLLGLAACDSQPKTETQYVMETQLYEAPDSGVYRRTVFSYTDEGKIESMIVYENDEETGRVDYELNEDGLLWKQISTEASGTTETMEYTYTLDAGGNPTVVEQTVNGEPYATSQRTYDAEGNLAASETTYTQSGMTSTITYTASGDILTMETDYGTGQVFTTEYTYDEAGNPLTCVTVDASGRRETVYAYDGQGRQIKTTEYLEDGSVGQSSETSYDGLAETSRSYGSDGTMNSYTVITRDEHGNTLTQEFYTADGSLMFRQSFTWRAVEVPVE